MAVKSAQAIVNGQTIDLTLNSSTGKWEAAVTAPSKSSYGQSGHYYGVTLKATDDAGNVTTVDVTDTTLGAALKLIVKEKVAPVISITNPTSQATLKTNKPAIEWKVTDNDSGVNPDTISLTIDSGSKVSGTAIKKTAISGGYSCSYTLPTALTDGSHTIKFAASDYDGNAATQGSVTFKVDTTPPTLSITSPVEGYVTNKNTITVSGITNDVTSSPVTVTINGKAATVASDGKFNLDVTMETIGNNSIVTTAKDSAGQTTTVTRIVKYDPNPPKITDASVSPNPVDTNKTYIISVTIIDD